MGIRLKRYWVVDGVVVLEQRSGEGGNYLFVSVEGESLSDPVLLVRCVREGHVFFKNFLSVDWRVTTSRCLFAVCDIVNVRRLCTRLVGLHAPCSPVMSRYSWSSSFDWCFDWANEQYEDARSCLTSRKIAHLVGLDTRP